MLLLPSFPGCVSLDSCTWIFSFKFAVSLHLCIAASLGTDKHNLAANNTANNTYTRPPRLGKPPKPRHVAHIHHVRTPVQANLLVLAPDQAVLARPEPAAVASHRHRLGPLLLPPVLARRETLDGLGPQRAPDTADVGVQLALGVPLGSLFQPEPCRG